ncbi:glycosyltransferase family 4 protein [Brevundimonas faecalis]|uniref:Glycosyltransferase involved in cell wall biosynthesis n=1 Tax=Brevundimonas faecalis TaxID=947378 RepID=A0ABV2R6U3_9CAUL
MSISAKRATIRRTLMDSPVKITKISLVVPSLFHRDGIGHAVLSTRLAFKAAGLDVTIFCRRSDFSHNDIVTFEDTSSLITNNKYIESNIIIFFVGIIHNIFNLIWLGNGHALRIVRFHNVTPGNIAHGSTTALSDITYLDYPHFIHSADIIWCDSEFNRQAVIAHGASAQVISLPVRNIRRSPTRWSARRLIKIVYVGRLVKSKNLEDLLLAVEILSATATLRVQLTIASSSRHADASILKMIRDKARQAADSYRIRLKLDLSQSALDRLYRDSNIFATASLHEGFCIPVLEALSAGALPVTYSNSNLQYIGGGLSVLSHNDTPSALAAALEKASHMLLNRPADDHEPYLEVAAGTFSFDEFDAATAAYLQNFTLEALGSQMIRSIQSNTSRRGYSHTNSC